MDHLQGNQGTYLPHLIVSLHRPETVLKIIEQSIGVKTHAPSLNMLFLKVVKSNDQSMN